MQGKEDKKWRYLSAKNAEQLKREDANQESARSVARPILWSKILLALYARAETIRGRITEYVYGTFNQMQVWQT